MKSSSLISFRRKSCDLLLLVPIYAFLFVYSDIIDPIYGLNVALPISTISGGSSSITSSSSHRSSCQMLRKKYRAKQPWNQRRSLPSKQLKYSGDDEDVDNFALDPKFLARNKYWIVIVDDEESMRLAVGDYLYDQGYQITACKDADALLELCCVSTNTLATDAATSDPTTVMFHQEEDTVKSSLSSSAIIKLPTKLPDLIVCDIRMPGTDGIELLKIIRHDDSLRYIPFVLLTAKAMTQDRIRGYKAGANAYLPKPFYPEELLSIVDNTLTRQQQILDRRSVDNAGGGGGGDNHHPHFDRNEEEEGGDKMKQGIVKKTSLIKFKQDLADIKRIMKQNSRRVVQKTDVFLPTSEREVLELLCQGYTNKQIATTRNVSHKNINTTVQKLLKNTESSTRTELVRWAIKTGYVAPR